MSTTTGASPDILRNRLVDHIAAKQSLSKAVETTMRAVPRHHFLPRATPNEAYADQAVITKRAANGAFLSCAGVPSLVATMLDQLAIVPGDHILEIGAGTGYNAALLAHLTGPTGQVTTIDIDPEVTQDAQRALTATGHDHVRVVCRDGALGAPEHAPYQRIIVTVGAWDIPASWWDQLAIGGRLVVPLRWRGQTRTIALIREPDCLRSESIEFCGFVPMIGQDGERHGTIDDDGHVTLCWDADQSIDPNALNGVLRQRATTIWTGITVVANEPFDGIWLRLTAAEPGTCRIAADPPAITGGLCAPAIPVRTPAIVENDCLTYLTLRELAEGEPRRWELGAIGHGRLGADLAERLCAWVRTWDRDRTARPQMTVHPRSDADDWTHISHVVHKPNLVLEIVY